MKPSSREQYRRLAAVLHDAQSTTGLQVVMVASAVAGEGKTLTAANLALTFSESYQKRVLLIDADLRRPTLHAVFRLDTASGLADGLSSTQTTQDAGAPGIVAAGGAAGRTAQLRSDGRPDLASACGGCSTRRGRFDWVILDTPPVVLLPDAHLLASMVDGALLVVRAGSTPHELVRRAVEAIGRSRILGVVLNRAEPSGQHDHYAVLRLRDTRRTTCRRDRDAVPVPPYSVSDRSGWPSFETSSSCRRRIAAVVRVWARGPGDLFVNETASLKTLLVAAVAQVSLYYADLYDLGRRRPARAVRPARPGTRRDVVRAGAVYFWFPALIRPRRVPDRGRASSWRWSRLARRVRVAERPSRPARAAAAGRHQPGRRRLWPASSSSGATSSASRSSASSIPIRRRSARRPQPGRDRHDRDIPSIVRASGRGPRRGQPGGRARQAAGGQAARDEADGVTFDHLASVYEEYTGKIAVENLRPSWLIFSDGFRKTPFLSPPSDCSTSLCATVGLVLALAAHGWSWPGGQG